MVVGEAPGRNEDAAGHPFIGRAGALLDDVLADAFVTQFARRETFVTNAAKCRPPANRTPKTSELRACETYLIEEIRLVDPWVILACGNAAIWSLLREQRVTHIRGQWHRLDRERETWVLPTYHPAFVLRQGLDSLAAEQFKDDVQMFATRAIVFMGEPHPSDQEGRERQ